MSDRFHARERCADGAQFVAGHLLPGTSVAGSIAPWDYPLRTAAWKILPAVAAGNTIVLKPGLPDGVVDVVRGTGTEAGEHLVRYDSTEVAGKDRHRTIFGDRT